MIETRYAIQSLHNDHWGSWEPTYRTEKAVREELHRTLGKYDWKPGVLRIVRIATTIIDEPI